MQLTFADLTPRTPKLKRLTPLLLILVLCVTGSGVAPSPDQTPGAPAGSYSLSGFEDFNLYNGHLNIALPLVVGGGRGAARYSLVQRIAQYYWYSEEIPPDNEFGGDTMHLARNDEFEGLKGTFGIGGGLSGSMNYDVRCNVPNGIIWANAWVRFLFLAPDGTRHEFRSQVNNGRPYQISCHDPNNGPSVGNVFISTDGTGATFVSDTNIRYLPQPDPATLRPSGYVKLADGTHFRIDQGSTATSAGKIAKIRDANGNTISVTYEESSLLNYPHQRLSSVTDTLGRQVNICYAGTPACPNNTYDQITYLGFGAAPRTIKIRYDRLSALIRPGLSVPANLFPELDGYSTDNPFKLASVEMPDNRSYKFYYNPYGEVARVELPTGGAYEYDHTAGSGVNMNDPFAYQIYRRLVKRRVYPNGGTGDAYEQETVYEDSYETTTPRKSAFITEKHYNSPSKGRQLVSATKHYFHGDPRSPVPNNFGYGPWYEGREYRTETLSPATGQPLRTVAFNWQQREPVSWWAAPYCWSQYCAQDYAPTNDPRIVDVTTTLHDVSPNLVSKLTYGYDASVPFNRITDVSESDFGQGSPPPRAARRTHTDYVTVNPVNGIDYVSPGGVHLRHLKRAQQVYSINAATGAETLAAQSEIGYDEFSLLPRPGVINWADPGGARGNPTSSRQWLNTDGTWLETRTEYDQCGNAYKKRDARANKPDAERVTVLDYTDSFSDSTPRNTYAYATRVTSPIPDPSGDRASATSLETTTVYDFQTGNTFATTDANGQATNYRYADPLDRLTEITKPDGGFVKYEYGDQAADLFLRTLTYLDDARTRAIEARQYFDGLGRPTRRFLHDGVSPNPWSVIDSYYEAPGRVGGVSNSYRVAAPSASVPAACYACTTTGYDALGRVTTVTTADGSQTRTDYEGAMTRGADQKGRSRITRSNGIGQIVEVFEVTPADAQTVPVVFRGESLHAYRTAYAYDVLGNVRRVEQGGQLRYFAYDSLSRLIRSRAVEQGVNGNLALPAHLLTPLSDNNNSWSLAYSYDQNGNVSARTDARGVTMTQQYDNLDRPTWTSYSDGTRGLGRRYDGAANGRGRYWADYTQGTSGSSLTVESYDGAGRVTSQVFSFYDARFYPSPNAWSPGFRTEREYDKIGNVVRQKYPSGNVVDYSQHDVAGRLKLMTGNLGDGVQRTYAADLEYDEAGRLVQERFGTQTSLYHKLAYNIRGQLYDVRLSTYSQQVAPWNWNRGAIVNYYSQNDYGATTPQGPAQSGPGNNGNLLRSHHYVPADDQISSYTLFFQDYEYDSLNRLTKVTETSTPTWTQQYVQAYDYDRHGNRSINTALTWGAPELRPTVDPATNRLGVPAGQAGVMQYDPAGNLTADTYVGHASQRAYDAENRMTSETDSVSSMVSRYTYDSDGRRVRREIGGQETWQIYGIDGELLAEYKPGAPPVNPRKEYGYRNGELLVTAEKPRAGKSAPTATASSTYNPAYPASSVVDGDRKGMNWGAGGGWNDGTLDIYPDWVQVNFGKGGATVSEIDVFTIQDNYAAPSEPTEAMTFSTYGITSFRLEYFSAKDSTWRPITGASATGNNKVWRKFTFPAVSTTMIRLIIDGALASYSRVVEIEAYAPTQVRWLVPDHLGTPRMVADLTGSLAAVSRHDYLPFGDELFSPTGGRGFGNGYFGGDGVRQMFTAKERDNETGLDYFGARYYSPGAGRFTSVDPFDPITEGGPEEFALFLSRPQNWNKYAYGLNNPLKYIDPNGEHPLVAAAAAGAAIGGLFGGGVELVKQLRSGKSLKEVNWRKVGSKAASGAIFGATVGLTGGASLVTTTAALGAAGAVGGITDRAIDGDSSTNAFDKTDIAADTVAGALAGAGGHYAHKYFLGRIMDKRAAAYEAYEMVLGTPMQTHTIRKYVADHALKQWVGIIGGNYEKPPTAAVRGATKAAVGSGLRWLAQWDEQNRILRNAFHITITVRVPKDSELGRIIIKQRN